MDGKASMPNLKSSVVPSSTPSGGSQTNSPYVSELTLSTLRHNPTILPPKAPPRQRHRLPIALSQHCGNPPGIATRLILALSHHSRVSYASGRHAMPITSNSRSPARSVARSAMNSPYRYAVTTITSCTIKATKPPGGPITKSPRWKRRANYGTRRFDSNVHLSKDSPHHRS